MSETGTELLEVVAQAIKSADIRLYFDDGVYTLTLVSSEVSFASKKLYNAALKMAKYLKRKGIQIVYPGV